MAKIHICPVSARPPGETVVLDTGTNMVEVKEAFIGITFKTENGEELGVQMRDGGFEVHYSGDYGSHGFDAGSVSFRGGNITPMGKPFS